MEWEDGRATHRTHELDGIIGITGSGDIGARGVRRAPREDGDVEAEAESARWASEWLTPPPPTAKLG